MKTTMTIKTLIYIGVLMLGLILSRSNLYAGFVEPAEGSKLVVSVNTALQTFDEALMMGLQLMEQSRSKDEYGIIMIYIESGVIEAEVKLEGLKTADALDSAGFVRKYVKFI